MVLFADNSVPEIRWVGKLDFHRNVVRNRGPSEDDIGTPNGTKMEANMDTEMIKKLTSNNYLKMYRTIAPKSHQHGPNVGPKRAAARAAG